MQVPVDDLRDEDVRHRHQVLVGRLRFHDRHRVPTSPRLWLHRSPPPPGSSATGRVFAHGERTAKVRIDLDRIAALEGAIREVRGGDPLRPVAVLVPQPAAGPVARTPDLRRHRPHRHRLPARARAGLARRDARPAERGPRAHPRERRPRAPAGGDPRSGRRTTARPRTYARPRARPASGPRRCARSRDLEGAGLDPDALDAERIPGRRSGAPAPARAPVARLSRGDGARPARRAIADLYRVAAASAAGAHRRRGRHLRAPRRAARGSRVPRSAARAPSLRGRRRERARGRGASHGPPRRRPARTARRDADRAGRARPRPRSNASKTACSSTRLPPTPTRASTSSRPRGSRWRRSRSRASSSRPRPTASATRRSPSSCAAPTRTASSSPPPSIARASRPTSWKASRASTPRRAALSLLLDLIGADLDRGRVMEFLTSARVRWTSILGRGHRRQPRALGSPVGPRGHRVRPRGLARAAGAAHARPAPPASTRTTATCASTTPRAADRAPGRRPRDHPRGRHVVGVSSTPRSRCSTPGSSAPS